MLPFVHYVTSRSSDWLQVSSPFSFSIIAARAGVAVWGGAQNTASSLPDVTSIRDYRKTGAERGLGVFFFSFLGRGCRLVSDDGRERGRHAEHAHRVREQVLRIWRSAAAALLQGEDGGDRRLLPEKQRHLDRHLPQVRSVSPRARCTSTSRCGRTAVLGLWWKPMCFSTSITNINHAFPLVFVLQSGDCQPCILYCNHPHFLFVAEWTLRKLNVDPFINSCTRQITCGYALFVGLSVAKTVTLWIDESNSASIIDVLFCFFFRSLHVSVNVYICGFLVAQFPSAARRVGLVTWRAWLANGGGGGACRGNIDPHMLRGSSQTLLEGASTHQPTKYLQ